MDLTGIWKPYGRYVNKDQKITIQSQELTFWIGVAGPNPRQTTVHFRLVEEHSLRENHCCNLEIDEERFKNTDFIVHEETIEGKTVAILSMMIMELDGRGRIVGKSYVREEDYALVNDEFKSLAYQHWNARPSVTMMQMDRGGFFPIGMMSGKSGMSGGAGMMSGEMPAAAPNPVTRVEPWDCICGNKQITTRFCSECGMPMPK